MLPVTGFATPVVTEALRAASVATQMRTVLLGSLDGQVMTVERLVGEWPGVEVGETTALADTFFSRLLAGAPAVSSDASEDPWYSTVPAVERLGIRSYIGVPICGEDGDLLGTLCALDPSPRVASPDAVPMLRGIAAVIAAAIPRPGAVIRRTQEGWSVDGAAIGPQPDLVNALVLADLLGGATVGHRPPKGGPDLDDVGRLQVAVHQLEHALAARVTVEQAIGVLAERQTVQPRNAFDRLRRAARSRGRRVHDLAREVVASAHQAGVPLPPELIRRGGPMLTPAPRPPARPRPTDERSTRPAGG